MKFNPNKFDDPDFKKWFAGYRYIQDEYADDVAVEIVQSPHYAEVFRAWAKIERNGDEVDFRIPKAEGSGDGPCKVCLSNEKHQLLIDKLNNYFRNTEMADYMRANIEQVRNGCEVFNIYNANATLALVTRSLLKQYAAYNATNVLMFTKMIKDSPNRRILESMRFVRDVMDVDGYEPNGRGIRNIQKLRLVHAVIRARINAGKYDRMQVINGVIKHLTRVADVANDIAAKDNDPKLVEIVKYITAAAKGMNDKVEEIEKFNAFRKDKNNLRNINEKAEDLKRSWNYLIEIQNYIAVAAKWLDENTDSHNELTLYLDDKTNTTFPHLVNDLKRNAKEIEWNEAEWGNPINQQDMIFAVHTFSIEVLDGLTASGEDLEQKEKEDYYMVWHHIGHCLGVKDEINPLKYDDGKRMQELIYRVEFNDYNPNGPALAAPLLRFMKSILPFNSGSQIRAVISNYNDKDDYRMFKNNLQIDLNDIDEVNLFNLKAATFILKIIVMIRKAVRKKDDKYRYSSFILRHLGIVDQIDGRLSRSQQGSQHGVAFSGTDAEGEGVDESLAPPVSFPRVVLKSVWSKAIAELREKFSSKSSSNGKRTVNPSDN